MVAGMKVALIFALDTEAGALKRSKDQCILWQSRWASLLLGRGSMNHLIAQQKSFVLHQNIER